MKAIVKPDYREKLEVELKELRESELWQAGKTVRSLRPENQPAEETEKKKVEAVPNTSLKIEMNK